MRKHATLRKKTPRLSLWHWRGVCFLVVLGSTATLAAAQERDDSCALVGGNWREGICEIQGGTPFLNAVSDFVQSKEGRGDFRRPGEFYLGIRRADVLNCRDDYLSGTEVGFGGSPEQLEGFIGCLEEKIWDVRKEFSTEIEVCRQLPVANPNLSIYRGAIVAQRGTNYRRILSSDSFPVCGFQLSFVIGTEVQRAAMQSCLTQIGHFSQALPLVQMKKFQHCYEEEQRALNPSAGPVVETGSLETPLSVGANPVLAFQARPEPISEVLAKANGFVFLKVPESLVDYCAPQQKGREIQAYAVHFSARNGALNRLEKITIHPDQTYTPEGSSERLVGGNGGEVTYFYKRFQCEIPILTEAQLEAHKLNTGRLSGVPPHAFDDVPQDRFKLEDTDLVQSNRDESYEVAGFRFNQGYSGGINPYLLGKSIGRIIENPGIYGLGALYYRLTGECDRVKSLGELQRTCRDDDLRRHADEASRGVGIAVLSYRNRQ